MRTVKKVGVRGGKGRDEVDEGCLSGGKRGAGDGFQAHEKYRKLSYEGFEERWVFLEVGDQRRLARSVAGGGVDVKKGFQRLEEARLFEFLRADEDVSGTAGCHHGTDDC